MTESELLAIGIDRIILFIYSYTIIQMKGDNYGEYKYTENSG